MSVDQSPPQTNQAPDTGQVMGLLGDLEERLGKLKQWQVENDRHGEQCRVQAEQLEQQRAAIEQRDHELSSKQSEVDGAWDELNQQKSAIDQRRAELEAEHQQLQDGRRQISEESQKLDEAWSNFRDQESALNELDAQCQDQKQKLDEQREQFEQQQAQFTQQREQVDEARGAIEQQKAELSESRRQFEADRAQVTDQKTRLEAEQSQVDQLKSDLSEQKKLYETERFNLKLRAEALDAQQQQLERARTELAEQAASGAIDPAEGRQIETVKEELEKTRNELRQRNEELEQRSRVLDDLAAELEQQAESLRQREADPANRNSDKSQQSTETQQQAAELQERANELEARAAELETRGAELEKLRAELQQKQHTYRDAVHKGKDQLTAEREELRRREKAVSQQLEELKKQREKYGQHKSHIKGAGDTLQSRRTKLHRYRKLLGERSKALRQAEIQAASSSAQYAGLDKERQMLIEVKRFLETSESEMVKRWSTGKAANTVIGVMIALMLMAAFSYGLGLKLVQPQWKSTMQLEVKTPGLPTASAAWVASQKDTLLSESVLTETVHQLNQRGVHSLTSVPTLKAHLAQQLSVTGSPPSMVLSYRTTSQDQVVTVLEAVGRSYLGYRMAEDRAEDRDDTTKIVQTATSTEVSVQEEQLKVSGIAFGAMAGAGLLLFLIAKLMFARSRRVFDPKDAPELSVLDKPDTWSPLNAASQPTD